MGTFLRLHLEGIQQSWGEYTADTQRPSLRFPTRSGVAGILSASLGLLRGDPRIPLLHENVRVHSRVLREGGVVEDYGNHTNYSVEDGWESSRFSRGKKVSVRDRRLNVFDLGTKEVSGKQIWREFLEDWAFEVLVEILPGSPFTPEEIAQALREPKFFQYLGRKSCFPLYPIMTELLEAANPFVGFRLPKAGEVLIEDPKALAKRYFEGGMIHLDSPTLTEEEVPEGYGVLPLNVRDAVRGAHGRIFHERRGWSLTPPLQGDDE